MTAEAQAIIKKLELQPHPEGGYFKETYRSKETIGELPEVYSGRRNFSTCIYFLLTSESFSAFHRIHQDEVWHFYGGAPITIHVLTQNGEYSEITLGNSVLENEIPQYVVQGGCWFGASVAGSGSYSLVGCTVSPGFDFTDFTLAKREFLLHDFPQHRVPILALTRI